MDAMALLCLASLGILAEGIPAPRSNAWSGQMVVDASGRLMPMQDTVPVIRKVGQAPVPPVPTDWPRQSGPKHQEFDDPALPPEVEREAQISKIMQQPSPRNVNEPRATQAKPPETPGRLTTATDLLILSSGAFLLPAHRGGQKGLNWLSCIFAMQAIICGVYHYCDQHRVGTDLDGPVCSETTYRFWHLADHGMAYFIMLQMAFLILGPEDPTLRRLAPSCGGGSLVAMGTRICPAGVLSIILWLSARSDHAVGSPAFHLVLGGLCCLLFLFGKGSFWLLRPAAAAHTLALPQAWLRLVLCFSSVGLSILLFLGMQTVANDKTKVGMGGYKAYAHSMWHVAAAVLAAGVLELLEWQRLRFLQQDFQGHEFFGKDVRERTRS
ncbi:unnamed protein product [Effrenium voratum]|uniref:Uncharacterized protein n=1 Tax=Effrenium voratum TaxID=2562239 RepID=A0AA36IBG7_9DINO|nr:unnamed protein product [Effrenium voratum]CAJ1384530.1 unnamed protein product [Effrenium voratum]CAJ1455974.1 unnamed protein product [Effrenium voratum]|mmetsp:Transcript_119300/g.283195  ORF Transcript_119300/g.283195 Transcript_119300/m.283195 type:complete len:382 (-) Transcript_119300:6-1151(-)